MRYFANQSSGHMVQFPRISLKEIALLLLFFHSFLSFSPLLVLPPPSTSPFLSFSSYLASLPSLHRFSSLLLSLSPDTMRRRPSSVNEFWRSPGPLTIASRRAASHVCIRPRGSVPFRYVANINESGVQIRTHPSFLFYRPKLFARYTRQRRKIPWRTFSC